MEPISRPAPIRIPVNPLYMMGEQMLVLSQAVRALHRGHRSGRSDLEESQHHLVDTVALLIQNVQAAIVWERCQRIVDQRRLRYLRARAWKLKRFEEWLIHIDSVLARANREK